MAVTKEEVVEFIANMTVLELSEFIKELEEKFGVSAAAPAAAMTENCGRFSLMFCVMSGLLLSPGYCVVVFPFTSFSISPPAVA